MGYFSQDNHRPQVPKEFRRERIATLHYEVHQFHYLINFLTSTNQFEFPHLDLYKDTEDSYFRPQSRLCLFLDIVFDFPRRRASLNHKTLLFLPADRSEEHTSELQS